MIPHLETLVLVKYFCARTAVQIDFSVQIVPTMPLLGLVQIDFLMEVVRGVMGGLGGGGENSYAAMLLTLVSE